MKRRFGQAVFRAVIGWVFLFGLLLAGPLLARAQLVNDGETNVLDGVATNIASGITIGTNGAFTLLVVTNGATVTNSSGNVIIGSQASAPSNRVVVAGTGSTWKSAGSFTVGQNSSDDELDILDGGLVMNSAGTIGLNAGGSNNLVLVSGPGSRWFNSSTLFVGGGGAGNTLMVTNGGRVVGNGIIGNLVSASNNCAIVTGPGSSWISASFQLGESSSRNQLLVNNGGALLDTNGSFVIGFSSAGNCLTVADPGSALTCQTFQLGDSGTANQCIVSNGAMLKVLYTGTPAAVVEGTFSVATITGAGSVWTNGGDLHFGSTSNVLSITAGGTLWDNNSYVRCTLGKPDTIVVAGTNSQWINRIDLHFQELSGQIFITNGGMVIDNHGYLGDGTSLGYALVSGSGSTWSNLTAVYVGNGSDSNQLVIADSGLVYAENLYLGSGTSTIQTNNQVTVNGGQLIATTSFGTIASTRGTFTLNSGLVQCGMFNILNGAGNWLVFNGGTLRVANSTLYTQSTLAVGDGVNPATLELTTLNGVGGTHSFNNALVISSNALLTGVGTVNGSIAVGTGATLAPGTSNILNLTVNGSLGLSNGCTVVMGLNPISGTNNSIGGLAGVVYNGTLQLTNLGGAYAGGQSYRLFSSGVYLGAFNQLVPSTPAPGLRWDTNELNIDGVLRIFSTTTPPPLVSVAVAPGNQLVLTATGGIAWDPCYLLTSTNLTAGPSGWTCIRTNYFDVTGAASVTNAISPAEPARFYQVQVN